MPPRFGGPQWQPSGGLGALRETLRDQLCDSDGDNQATMMDVDGLISRSAVRFSGVRAGPDEAEVSGSSPLRPTRSKPAPTRRDAGPASKAGPLRARPPAVADTAPQQTLDLDRSVSNARNTRLSSGLRFMRLVTAEVD